MVKIRISRNVILAIAGVFLLIIVLYACGVITVLGHTTTHQKSKFFVSKEFPGFSWGVRTVWLKKDWEIYADYQVDARAGSLNLALMDFVAPLGSKMLDTRNISGQQSGRVTFRAPRSGMFRFCFYCTPLHGPSEHEGYFIDVNYSLTWGLLLR